jgi:hypothetical protein
MKPSLPPRHVSRSALLLLAAAALCGCAWFDNTFSQSVGSKTDEQIHAMTPVGTPIADAEARLEDKGFDCTARTGHYADEHGRDHDADRFLSCVQRPSRFGFTCENRDQVIVVDARGVVDEVEVVRGPDCTPQQVASPPTPDNIPK